jgi:amino acid transporter
MLAAVPEDDASRLDRELIELLNELRVTLPGVQVLFAFLLTVPFNNRFEQVTDLQEAVYFVALLATAAGSVFLIAPTPYHRIRFRDRDKEALIRISNRLALIGTVFLAVGATCAVFFVTDFLFNIAAALAVAGVVAVTIVGLWYVLPLSRELRD